MINHIYKHLCQKKKKKKKGIKIFKKFTLIDLALKYKLEIVRMKVNIDVRKKVNQNRTLLHEFKPDLKVINMLMYWMKEGRGKENWKQKKKTN